MNAPLFGIRLEGETLSFNARHFITYRLGKKESEPIVEEPHTHRFRATAELTGPLDEFGLLIDFHLANRVFQQILQDCSGKTFLALNQAGLSIEQIDGGYNVHFTSFIPETSAFRTEQMFLPYDTVVPLKKVNASAEMIAFYLASLFRNRLTAELGRADFPYRLTLTLEEFPGMKAVVTL